MLSYYARLSNGPLEDFVRRRAALVKSLRSDGELDAAGEVKAFRKPSRTAWALNLAAHTDALGKLVAAVDATVKAQTRGGDVRGTIATMREAVRAFASQAAQAASAYNITIDASDLSTAVLAVLGSPRSFGQMQRASLDEVPEGGGLDFMTSFPVLTVSSAAAPTAAVSAVSADRAIILAESCVADCRSKTDEAMRVLNRAESDLDSAEQRLKDARAAVEEAKSKRDRARKEMESANAAMRDAEEKLGKLRAD